MLDDLTGISGPRAITKGRDMSLGLKHILTCEMLLMQLYHNNGINGVQDLLPPLVSQCPATPKDLEQYVIMRQGDSIDGRQEARGLLTGALVPKVYELSKVAYFNGFGCRFNYLFENVNFDGTLIIDNIKSYFASKMFWPRERLNHVKGRLVFTNSEFDYIATFEKHKGTCIIANCDVNKIFSKADSGNYFENLFFINSHCKKLIHRYENDSMLAFIGSEADRLAIHDPDWLGNASAKDIAPISEDAYVVDNHMSRFGRDTVVFGDDVPIGNMRRLKELAAQMKGKNGLEIYDLAFQMVKNIRKREYFVGTVDGSEKDVAKLKLDWL